ncbi:S35A2-like protein [Mya arenaria]|uniref:S35A2-like protein n=1 Tax=Mya arenaria TaxID=6604 RepID=A0ABY7FYC5_MYAAR|nr:S35A2-like protein [Mya arenaria]
MAGAARRLKLKQAYTRTLRILAKMPAGAGNFLKYLSLVLLTAQNAVFILSMRYVRTRDGDLFFTTTAVILQESIKCVLSMLIILYQLGGIGAVVGYVTMELSDGAKVREKGFFFGYDHWPCVNLHARTEVFVQLLIRAHARLSFPAICVRERDHQMALAS